MSDACSTSNVHLYTGHHLTDTPSTRLVGDMRVTVRPGTSHVGTGVHRVTEILCLGFSTFISTVDLHPTLQGCQVVTTCRSRHP